MEKIYSFPEAMRKPVSGYCPGCMHSTIHKLCCQVVDELGIREKTVVVLPVGCASLGIYYWNFDMVAAAHGRAPAIATGLKRSSPDSVVFAYQGDGDLASIGMAETIHAANRGENITVVFVNNSIYGMTGGQMAPTTLVGMKATTAPRGRDPKTMGYPINVAEMIAGLTAPVFVGRFAVDTAAHVNQAKAAIKKGIQNQIDGKGYSFIEILSNCPTNWGMSPLKTMDFIHEQTMKQFPLGVFKDIDKEAK